MIGNSRTNQNIVDHNTCTRRRNKNCRNIVSGVWPLTLQDCSRKVTIIELKIAYAKKTKQRFLWRSSDWASVCGSRVDIFWIQIRRFSNAIAPALIAFKVRLIEKYVRGCR